MVAAPTKKRSPKSIAEVFEGHWQRLLKSWKHVQAGYSKNQVHDFRVAVRRFLAVIDLYVHLDKKFDSRKCRRFLKDVLKASGPLRDAQVESGWIAGAVLKNPQLQEFADFANDKESRAVKDLKKILKKDSLPPGRISKAAEKASRTLADCVQSKTRMAAVAAVDGRYRRLTKRLSDADPADMKSIHRVRVALKQFRYAAEIAQPFSRDRLTPQIVRQIKDTQAALGHIQDIQVLTADLRRWIGKDQDRAVRVNSVVTQLEAERQEAVSVFTEVVGRISGFWKARSR